MKFKLLLTLLILSFSMSASAIDLRNRLGVGYSQELVHEDSTISLKLQGSPNVAYGMIFGASNRNQDTNYSFGAKIYNIIFDEPNLSFYLFGLASVFTYDYEDKNYSGRQLTTGFGSEFHLPGIRSLGFSFEFGINFSKYNKKNSFETFGNSIVKSAVHFYL